MSNPIPSFTLPGFSFSDIAAAIVGPITSAIAAAAGPIINAIATSFGFLSSIGSQIASAFTSTFSAAFNQVLVPIGNFFTAIPQTLASALSNLGTSIGQFLAAAGGNLTNAFSNLGNVLNQAIVQPLSSYFNALSANLGSIFASVQQTFLGFPALLTSTLSNFGQGLLQGFVNFGTSLIGYFANLQAKLSDFSADLTIGLSNFGTAFTNFGTQFNAAMGTFASAIWVNLNNDVVQPFIKNVLNQFNSIVTFAADLNATVKNTLLAVLPRTPDDAITSAITVAEIGVATIAAGELASLGLEALYPTKHLGIQEALHKITDITGITAISGTLYGIIVQSGWGRQLSYYFNYQLQPQKIDQGTAERAVWYQQRSVSQYMDDLRFEGYNDDAIEAKVATLYRPIPFRMLTKFIDNGVFNDNFMQGEITKAGFDPALLPQLLQAFQVLKVAQYQSIAKTVIHTVYQHGYLNAELATSALTLVGTPPDQIKIILYFATIAAQDALLSDLETEVLNEVKKGQTTPADAITILTDLGLDVKRATAKVRIAALQSAPTLPKSAREDILTAALSIPLLV